MAVTERQLQRLVREGVFRILRLGTSVRYFLSDLDEQLRRLAEGDKAEA